MAETHDRRPWYDRPGRPPFDHASEPLASAGAGAGGPPARQADGLTPPGADASPAPSTAPEHPAGAVLPAEVRAAPREADGPTPAKARQSQATVVETLTEPIAAPMPAVLTSPTLNGKGRRHAVRRRARRVTRIVRRIDLWSVLKLALILYTCIYVATMAAFVVIWGVAYSAGLIDKLQSFLGDVGLDNFRFYGDQMFRASAAIGAVMVLTGTVITVLSVALVNLISEMTGGIRVIVIEVGPEVVEGTT